MGPSLQNGGGLRWNAQLRLSLDKHAAVAFGQLIRAQQSTCA